MPAATASRGSETPSIMAVTAAFSGWRAASAASRSTTRPTTAGRLHLNLTNAKATDLDHAGQRLGRPNDQTS